MMGMRRVPQMLEPRRHVPHHPLVNVTKVSTGMPKRATAEEVMEVPCDEQIVESIIIGDKDRATFSRLVDPCLELSHNLDWIIESQMFLTGVTTDRQSGWYPLLGDRPGLTIERLIQFRGDFDGTKRHHRIIIGAWDWSVCFDIDTEITHSILLTGFISFCQ